MESISGNLSPDEEEYVQKMLVEDSAFKNIWQSLQQKSDSLKAGDFLANINVEDDLHLLKSKIVPFKKKTFNIFSIKKMATAAAVIIFVMAGTYFFVGANKIVNRDQIVMAVEKNKQSINLRLANGSTLVLSKDSGSKTIALSNVTISTGNGRLQYSSADTMQNTLSVPEGDSYKIVLSDGTEVWLNAATSLRFPFHFYGKQREVYVDGEAFFKVTKDAAHPFIVHTSLTQVQVLGTSFNVNTYNQGNVKTALVEGKVTTTSNDGKRMELKPGFAADYKLLQGFESATFDEEEVCSWLKGVYYFHNMPLTELAAIASRCYGIKIELDKKTLAGKSITGLLNTSKLSDFLNDLETAAEIKYYYSGNQLHLQ